MTGIWELAIVVLIAAVLGIAAKLLRQPTILAYLAAGVVIGYFGFFHFGDREIFQVFSDLGIMFLLFLVGLEINYTSLRLVGKPSLIIGLSQIVFTFFFGFLISTLFGFGYLASGYIAIALTFSSTIIVVQLLSAKRALGSLYGKLSIGFLLVQDFVAILILVVLAGIETGGELLRGELLLTLIEGMVLFAVIFVLGRRFFPWLFDKIAHSPELLFISSLAWLFALAALVEKIGFSIEIGGFLAGLALANSSEHFEISARMRSLRDFFILVFFAILGSSLLLSNFSGLLVPIVVLSLFVLIGNPIIVLIVMSLMGYTRRTSFFAGLTVAQISEFSLILVALGFRLGHISGEVAALVTAIGVVTITVSTYLIMHAEKLFRWLKPHLGIFKSKKQREAYLVAEEVGRPIVLIGGHRTGEGIITHLPKSKLLIIDFDPEVIKLLTERGYNCMFGDISDYEIFERTHLDRARLVISTSPNLDDNLTLLTELKKKKSHPKIVLRAENEKEAEILYASGADYVLMPQVVSGHYLSRILGDVSDLRFLDVLRRRDIKLLEKKVGRL